MLPPSVPLAINLDERLEELARDLGRLRYATAETPYEWHVERLCEQLYWILLRNQPTASDLYLPGMSDEAVLAVVDAETLRLRRLLGTPERNLRLAGLID